MTIVWIWTVTHAIGLGVQSVLIARAVGDWRYSVKHQLGNGDRRRLLREHVRSGCAYWVMHAIFLYVGLRVLIGFEFGAIPYLFVAAGIILVLAGLGKLRDRTLLARSR